MHKPRIRASLARSAGQRRRVLAVIQVARSAVSGLATVIAVVIAGCEPRTSEKADAGIPALVFELDLRIDATEHELVPVSWLGVSPAGVIAAIQGQDYRVVFFDSMGAYLGAVGRRGLGPGEFQRLVRGGWVGDTLWIRDARLRRVTLVDAERNVSRMVTLPSTFQSSIDGKPPESYRLADPFAVRGDTLLVAALQAASPSAGERPDFPFLRVTPDGKVIEEVTRVSLGNECSVGIRVPRGTHSAPVPFCTRPRWAVSPSGSRIAVVTTDASNADAPFYSLRVVDATGHVIVNRTFPFEPMAIPAAAIDSAVNAELTHRPTEVRAELESMMRDAAPSIYPQVERIVIGDDDRLWIGLRRTVEGQPWVVLSPDGKPSGHVILPLNVKLQVAGAAHIWATERDELDLESIVRYRIEDVGRH